MKKSFCSFFLISYLAGGLLFAQSSQEAQITATLDKSSASVNDEVGLLIKISGAQGNIQAPRLPNIQGVDAFYTGRSSHFTFVNGQSTSTVDFSYVLVPRKEGSYNIPAIEVVAGGKTMRTAPMELSVRGVTQKAGYSQAPPPVAAGTVRPQAPAAPAMPRAGAAQRQPQPQPDDQQEAAPAFVPQDVNIFAKAVVDKTTAFPNQQILLTYSLYTRYDTRYEGFDEEPQVSGFWIEEFPQEREVKRENVHVNNLRYIKADIRKMALFPTAPAEYTIQPGTLKASIRQEPVNQSVFDEFFNDSFFSGGSFFSRRENRLLKPPPIHITVLPFPENGKPDSFQGAVGNFRIVATIDKQNVKQNEPVTVKFVIEGEGNIDTLNRPKIPEIKGVRNYDADTSSQLFQTGDVIGGRKVFESVFIPTEPGKMTIPKLEFSFFNPNMRSYQVLNTPEFNVLVEKSDQVFKMPEALSKKEEFKKDIKVEGRDIHFIEEKLPPREHAAWALLSLRFLAVADILLFLLLLTGFWQGYQEKIFAKDGTLKRRRFARQQAEIGIRKIAKLARSKKPEERGKYFDEIDKTLTQYLSDKFGMSAYGASRVDLEHKLAEVLGGQDPLYQEIMSLYQLCDELRFARGDVAWDQKAKAVKILKSAISRMERIRIK
jgi:hypothetical protein